jgi:hypothetical protein
LTKPFQSLFESVTGFGAVGFHSSQAPSKLKRKPESH